MRWTWPVPPETVAAVDSWVAGDEAAARQRLEENANPFALRLRDLLGKERIRVLANLRHDRSRNYDMYGAMSLDRRFLVRRIEPAAGLDIREHLEFRPDLYVCFKIESEALPPNLGLLPCPVIGHTADYDIHIQTIRPWLAPFDGIVVTDESERRDVARLVDDPVWTFPKVFGVAEDLPEPPGPDREYDVFISGLLFHPYHPEKAALVGRILRMEGIRPLVVDGMTNEAEYNWLLGRSKVVFTFVRHAGAMPTRGLEALAHGCAVVVQRESVLGRFFGEDDGVIAYDGTPGGLEAAVRRILADWPAWAARARQGSARVRREFAFPRCASEYLRFLTVFAAFLGTPRWPRPVVDAVQKRVLACGGIQGADAATYAAIAARTIETLRPRAAADLVAAIDLAREILLGDERDRGEVFDLLRATIRRWPRALAPRLLFVRAGAADGDAAVIDEALAVAAETVDAPREDWSLPAAHDVLPYDFRNRLFHYRRYLDLVVAEATGHESTERARIDVALASIHHHIAVHDRDAAHARAAVDLDPTFPWYRIHLVEVLLRAGLLQEAAGHVPALLDLFRSSAAPREAYEVIVMAHAAGLVDDRTMEAARAEMKLLRARVVVPGAAVESLRATGFRALAGVRRVAVFGAGATGRSALADLRAHGIEIAFFIDNVARGEVEGVPIRRPDEAAAHLDGVDAIVLATGGIGDLMRAQLRALGVRLPVLAY